MLPYIMVASLVLVYILSYALNKKVPVPKASLDKIDEAACKSCHNFTCSHRGDE